MKKLLALFLALVMLFGMTNALAVSTDYKDNSCWPITDEDITVNIGMVFRAAADGADPAKTWFFQWASEKSGLKFTFDSILENARSEKKSLMFASDDLPEVLWNYALSPVELVKYGSVEKQLLPLNEYITEDIMPNLCAWLKAYPDAITNITAPDGNIYSLPYFYKVKFSAGGATYAMISDMYLSELGLEKPRTLDEMTTALYAFKEKYPDKTPIGGCSSGYDVRTFFLNALGYLTSGGNDYGLGIAIRDGKLVIPCADEKFLDFLKLMNQYYQDGIISQDYFLLDSDTVKASLIAKDVLLAEGFDLGYTGSTYDDWKCWSAAYPLTSEGHDTPFALSANLFQTGGLALTHYCEHPVEFLKFMDFLYSDLGIVWGWYGPIVGHPDLEGYENTGWYWNEGDVCHFVGVDNGLYSDEYPNGLFTCNPACLCVGNNGYALNEPELSNVYEIMKSIAGHKNTEFEWDVLGNRDNYMRASVEKYQCPYETTDFPYYVYFTEEQTARVDELYTVLQPYVENRVAEFITGQRSLDEYPQFIEELEKMGIREYEAIYREATGR